MTDVFISYSRKDEDFGRKLYDELTVKQGLKVWIDWRAIPQGEEWWHSIRKGIEQSKNFVLVISPDSLASPICNLEIQHARQHHKRIVPILHRETNPASAFGSLAARKLTAFEETIFRKQDILIIARENWQEVSSINFLPLSQDDDFDSAVSVLLQIFDTDREYIREHTLLEQRAVEWVENERKRDFLRSGEALLSAEAWLRYSDSKNPPPTQLQKEYVQASVLQRARQEQAERERQAHELRLAQEKAEAERRNARRLRYFLGLVSVLLIVAVTLGLLALTERNRADRRADETRSLLLASDSLLQPDPDMALSMAVQANLIDSPSIHARRVLYEHANSGAILSRLDRPNSVGAVAFSPDGQTALSGNCKEFREVRCVQGELILWDVMTGNIIRRFEQPTSEATSIAFSPDGKTVLSGSGDGTAIQWDITTGEMIHVFEEHTRQVTSIAFSPDGQTVLAGSLDGTVVLWDVATGDVISRLVEHTGGVTSVAFSPDGRTALSGSTDNTVILWSVATGDVILRFAEHTDDVSSVAFSPDGRAAISGAHTSDSSSQEAVLILWDVTTGNVIRRFERQPLEEAAMDVVFNQDEQTAFYVSCHDYRSSCVTGEIILVDLATGLLLDRVNNRANTFRSVAFSTDRQHALSGGCSEIVDNRCGRGGVELYKLPLLPDGLLHWVLQNRTVPEFSCEQRERYFLDVRCDGNGHFPTRTPSPTLTPLPTRFSEPL